MVFKNLLVPLDGSKLAETILPSVIFFAQHMHSSVILIHTMEKNPPKVVHGETHLSDSKQAQDYLEKIKQDFIPHSINVDIHVHTSEVKDVARSIVSHGNELGMDLICLCTHGKGGIGTWLFGTIAQQVIGMGTTPVLLIQPQMPCPNAACTYQQLLLPLDGNPEHERAFPIALELAQVFSAELSLLTVVPTVESLVAERAATARLLPTSTRQLLDLAEVDAKLRLDSIVKKILPQDISLKTMVVRGEPVEEIIRTSTQRNVDLIILGTHGKRGQQAFWSGSVMSRVAAQITTPLLLTPVHA